MDEAVGRVQFAYQRNFLNLIISKLDKHVVLLLINYIACEVQQLCKENYAKLSLKINRLKSWQLFFLNSHIKYVLNRFSQT